MNTLRRLLHVVCGWVLGVAVTLAWVWVREGKASNSTGSAGLVVVLVVVASAVSVIVCGAALTELFVYMADGERK